MGVPPDWYIKATVDAFLGLQFPPQVKLGKGNSAFSSKGNMNIVLSYIEEQVKKFFDNEVHRGKAPLFIKLVCTTRSVQVRGKQEMYLRTLKKHRKQPVQELTLLQELRYPYKFDWRQKSMVQQGCTFNMTQISCNLNKSNTQNNINAPPLEYTIKDEDFPSLPASKDKAGPSRVAAFSTPSIPLVSPAGDSHAIGYHQQIIIPSPDDRDDMTS